MHTDRLYKSNIEAGYIRKRSRRRKRKNFPSVFPVLFILLAVFVIYLIFIKLDRRKEYNISTAIDTLYANGELYAKCEAFAGELAVISNDYMEAGDFVSESGLVLRSGDMEAVFSRFALEKMHPASTTKIMTALLALKYGNLDDSVTVGNEVVVNESGASMAGLLAGDTLSLRQLLYGLMLPSGNDAANAIAVHISGSTEEFAKLMTAEAKKIAATSSNFVNASGLTNENHYTSAYDLYLILNEALKYKDFEKISSTASYEVTYKDSRGMEVKKIWKNGNKYLTGEEKLPAGLSVVSGKTGTTKAAGNCLVLASTDNNKRYISIVLKADNRQNLYSDMTKLLVKVTN